MIPKNAKRIALRPLAFGEVTGHAHRLIAEEGKLPDDLCELYEHEPENGKRENGKQYFLRVTSEGLSLLHAMEGSLETADHERQSVAVGDYRVVIQEETTDWGTRQVAD